MRATAKSTAICRGTIANSVLFSDQVNSLLRLGMVLFFFTYKCAQFSKLTEFAEYELVALRCEIAPHHSQNNYDLVTYRRPRGLKSYASLNSSTIPTAC